MKGLKVGDLIVLKDKKIMYGFKKQGVMPH